MTTKLGTFAKRWSGQNVVAIGAVVLTIGMLGLTLVFPQRALIGEAVAFYDYTD